MFSRSTSRCRGWTGSSSSKELLPQFPIPVVIVSGLTVEGSRRALEALEAGAVAVVAKPGAVDREGLGPRYAAAAMLGELAEAIKDAARGTSPRCAAAPSFPSRAFAPERKPRSRRRPAGSWPSAPRRAGPRPSTRSSPNSRRGCPGRSSCKHMPPVFTPGCSPNP